MKSSLVFGKYQRGCCITLVLTMSSLLFLFGCGGDTDQAAGGGGQRRLPLVTVVPVKSDTIVQTLQLTAEVVSTERVEISATVEGPIAFFPWREGDQVEDGEKLIEINRKMYQSEVEAAEAALAVANARLADLRAGARQEEVEKARQSVLEAQQNANYEIMDMGRIELLVEAGALPGDEYDKSRVRYVSAQARLDSARRSLEILERGPTRTSIAVLEASVQETSARLAMAQARFDECIIYAPFSATVTKAYVRLGDMAAPRTPLLELVDLDSLAVRFVVAEAQSALVRKGMPLLVKLDALSDQEFHAEISRIYPELNPTTRTRTVEAEIIDPANIAPNMFARVQLEMARANNTLLIPAEAILITSAGDKMVYVIEDGMAISRTIHTGIEDGQQTQVLEGLAPGDNVVVAGNEQLEAGTAVRVLNNDKSRQQDLGGGVRNSDRTTMTEGSQS